MTSGKIKISFRSAAVLLAALALAPLLPRPAGAVINPTINYQGFLLSKVTSLPVETPQDLNFIIYDAPVGGNALFTEGRCNVNVAKGRYDVAIGSLTAGGASRLPSAGAARLVAERALPQPLGEPAVLPGQVGQYQPPP